MGMKNDLTRDYTELYKALNNDICLLCLPNDPDIYISFSWHPLIKIESSNPVKISISEHLIFQMDSWEDLIAEFIGCMAHLTNLFYGIKDTSSHCQYYNKRFRDRAIQYGLTVKQNGYKGWRDIKIRSNSRLSHIIQGESYQIIHHNITEHSRANDYYISDSAEQQKSRSYKYSCPKCGNNCRATKITKLKCGYCNLDMITDNREIMEICNNKNDGFTKSLVSEYSKEDWIKNDKDVISFEEYFKSIIKSEERERI